MKFFVNQPIKIISEYLEFNANVDIVSSNDFTATVFEIGGEAFFQGKTVIIEVANSDAVYVCEATVIKAFAGSRNCSCVFSMPVSSTRMQRRESVRINIKLPVEYYMEETGEKLYFGKIIDLSGNGMQLSSEIKLELDAILHMKLVLKNPTFHQTMNVKAKIIRQLKSAVGYQYGLS
ncbi:MAG: PilZ domain-containing protein, partial [Syntrophomonadaceae bacterium]|nr:PilZ domain-containing protein [Syntrophomonadaceae bacterium]